MVFIEELQGFTFIVNAFHRFGSLRLAGVHVLGYGFDAAIYLCYRSFQS